jgi:hypothetical protein
VTCFDDFKFLSEGVCGLGVRDKAQKVATITYTSSLKGDSITLLVFHIPNAIQRKVDAIWDKDEVYLAICSASEEGRLSR